MEELIVHDNLGRIWEWGSDGLLENTVFNGLEQRGKPRNIRVRIGVFLAEKHTQASVRIRSKNTKPINRDIQVYAVIPWC
jgi:hypothetical protein